MRDRPQQQRVPIARVQALLQATTERGIDANDLLSVVSLTQDELQSLECVPLLTFSALYQRSMWLVQDESFGMGSDGVLPNGAFRMMCLVLIQARDLRQALYLAADFYEICRGVIHKPVFHETPEEACVHLAPLSHQATQTPRVADANIQPGLSIWHRFLCWLLGQDIPLIRVTTCTSDKVLDKALLERIYGAPVVAGDLDAAFFSPEYLSMPIVQNRDSLRQFLKTAPYQLLVTTLDDSLSARVEAMLGKDFSRSLPTAEEVARQLGLSLSSFRRKLREEGASFQGIKDRCRQQAALTYLQSPALTIAEVAELLGFEEVSAFHRCFKRWTGQTPGQYRAKL